ncbi:hypothetical protein C8Q75DRAFT_771590 [Abortiporus biennis]|nr:hypothetical protein C8Q75DRAFT_771590 [Abortiporus biennis]
MPIQNPNQLIDEFKKSGEFDRLRRELLAQFRDGDGYESFMSRIEEIVKSKLESDTKLQYMPESTVSRELMQELDRYPIVERAVNEMANENISSGIKTQLTNILQADKVPRHGVGAYRNPSGYQYIANGNNSTPQYLPNPPPIHISPVSLRIYTDDIEPSPRVTTQEEERPRSVHFTDTTVTPATLNGHDNQETAEPGSPDSAMVESPISDGHS